MIFLLIFCTLSRDDLSVAHAVLKLGQDDTLVYFVMDTWWSMVKLVVDESDVAFS